MQGLKPEQAMRIAKLTIELDVERKIFHTYAERGSYLEARRQRKRVTDVEQQLAAAIEAAQ